MLSFFKISDYNKIYYKRLSDDYTHSTKIFNNVKLKKKKSEYLNQVKTHMSDDKYVLDKIV